MSCDSSNITHIRMIRGEHRPIYGQFKAASGTITLSADGTFTLTSKSGTVILNAVAVTGYDAGALTSARVWYLIDTSALTDENYDGLFKVTVTGSDSIVRVMEAELTLTIRPVNYATYSAARNSALDKFRFFAADTDPSTAIYSDVEVNNLLTQFPNPRYAAAAGLRAEAADNARLAIRTSALSISDDPTKVYEALMQMADALEARTLGKIVVNSPDRIFSTDRDSGRTLGTLSNW